MIHLQHRRWIAVLGATLMLFATCVAVDAEPASSNPSLTSYFTVQAGALYNRTDAEVGSHLRNSGAGGSIDLSDLGAGENHFSPYLSARWRATPRWHFEVSYHNISQNGRKGAKREINFADIVIPIGWNVSTDLDVSFFSGAVGYSFLKGRSYEFGGMVGLDVYSASAKISGSAFVGGATATRTAKESITIPVPTLGVFGTLAFNDRWSIGGKAQYLFAEYGDYSGDIFRASAEITYWFTPRTALAVGYTHVSADVSHEGARSDSDFRLQFGGPYAVVSLAF